MQSPQPLPQKEQVVDRGGHSLAVAGGGERDSVGEDSQDLRGSNRAHDQEQVSVAGEEDAEALGRSELRYQEDSLLPEEGAQPHRVEQEAHPGEEKRLAQRRARFLLPLQLIVKLQAVSKLDPDKDRVHLRGRSILMQYHIGD